MEFPHIGSYCAEKNCNKLDFLSMKCDACQNIFCCDHYSYIHHSCTSAHKNDFQVPVCPLCGDPVPTPRGVPADQTVGKHIDQYCKSESKKIFVNNCTYKNCKKKELIPVKCSLCNMNYCIKHRHTNDHECLGSEESQRKARQYGKTRPSTLFNIKSLSHKNIEKVQGNLSEDEAFAKALALSIIELDETANKQHRIQQQATVSTAERKDKCLLS